MPPVARSVLSLLLVLVTILSLAACGGGGGSKGVSIVDPAPYYTGVKTAAALSVANAEGLATSAYAGGTLGTAVVMQKAAAGKAAATRREIPVRQTAKVVNASLRRMQIPRAARKLVEARGAKGGKGVAKVETFQLTGGDGGYATYSIDVNQSDRTFAGTVTYNGYASGGLTLNGKTDILGTFDENYQGFTRLTLSFKELSMSIGGDVYTLIGSLSWGYTPATSGDSLTVNMVLVDSGKTYWFKDYRLADTYGADYLTQTLTGRYYDPEIGYVDLSTPTSLVIYYGKNWPAAGSVKCSGGQSAWVGMQFESQNYSVLVDLDNDQVVDWQARHAVDSAPDVNMPPIADAGVDQSVTQGATVTLDGSASFDPNNDQLTYYWNVDSYPQGGYPQLSGTNTATASFTPVVPGSYVLRLTVSDGNYASSYDTVTVTVTQPQPSDPNLLQLNWQYGLMGTSIGQAGLISVDLDGDGTPEIVSSASAGGFGANSLWYVLQRTSSGDYQQLWRSKGYGSTVVKLFLADLTGDGKDDIVVALANGTIEVYSAGATPQLVRTITTANGLCAVAVADLAGDGTKEIITSDGTKLYVYAAQSGALKWSLATGGGTSLAVGNVDADAALEIVTTTYGGKGYVIDGVTKAISWEYLNGFGSKVALGDLDGDGMLEIVGASSWYKITVFDADRSTPVWEIATSLDIAALLVADADGDGIPEIVYGDGQWGEVHAVDARTRTERWAVANPQHGVSGLALSDLDRDGKKELLWGAGGSSTGADYLYVADPLTGTLKWQSVHIDGPLSAVAVGDVDDDGEDEIVMVSFESESGYAEGVIHIFNARSHALEFRQKLGITDWMGVRSVKIGDVDGDGKTEFVVATGNIYDGVIRVYNGATHLLKKQSAGYNGNFFTALAIGDVDGDGKVEIVAGQGIEHTGATGSYLLVLDGATLAEKWRSVDTGASWSGIYDVKLADLNGDGVKEIIASCSGTSRLMVYDGVSHDLKLLIQHPARALEVADVDGNGTKELLVGRNDGKVDVFSGATLQLERTVNTTSTAPVDALQVADLAGDGSLEWLVASGGVLTVLDGAGGLKWKSGDLSANLGWYNHMGVKDCDGDGKKEIYLGSNLSLYQFK
ncbi:VCBS repeat-containing protein [Geomonas sp. Red69]|uniref:FG-GAP-like repeat-containing protein n=1 Tax=Geomonas diazotrophica TaxID=2843197 RepID=UPI001C1244A8|nr:FG-GAP-like repeat-containing protein [Geomonas diazotrophica]MBU5638326.1 VCBS repeat-containing protein [Geomonas diazotrophica]